VLVYVIVSLAREGMTVVRRAEAETEGMVGGRVSSAGSGVSSPETVELAQTRRSPMAAIAAWKAVRVSVALRMRSVGAGQ
jgi:hypothetical protein